MTESKKLSYFGIVPATGSYLTALVDVTTFQNIRTSIFCASNGTVNTNWSMDGINTDIIKTENVTAGVTISFSYPILTKYVQIGITGATPGAALRFQTYLNSEPLSLTSLASLGAGEEVYDEAQYGIKSLIGGSGITLTPSSGDITIDASGGVISPFQEVSAQITPITLTQTSLIGGENNSIDTSQRTFVWGQGCYTYPTNNDNLNIGLLASQNCGVTGANNGQACNSGCIFSRDCQNIVRGGNGPTEEVSIISSRSCFTYDDGGNERSCVRSSIIASLDSTLGGDTGGFARDSLQCLVGSSQNCEMDNFSGTCCSTILGSNSCKLGTAGPSFADADQLMILGSTGCHLGIVDNENRTTDCIISSINSNIDGFNINSTILNSKNCLIHGENNNAANDNIIINGNDSNIESIINVDGQCTRNTMINTKNSNVRNNDNVLINCAGVTGTHKGTLICGDSLLGFNSENDDQCLMKFTNGYKFYTGSATGIVAVAGAGSFASICQRSKKDNIVELDYNSVLAGLGRVPIYRYNYKGNSSEQINYGPMAEDYHREFTSLNYVKDRAIIESMDIIGLCLAAVKGLKVKLDGIKCDFSKETGEDHSDELGVLTYRIYEAELKIKKLFEKFDFYDAEINKLKNRIRVLELSN